MARGWFGEGLQAVEVEDWARAAELFQRVLRIKSSAVVAYNLASALSHLGRVREAADLLRPIARDPEAGEEARVSAEELLRSIETRIGAVTVRATGDTEGITLLVRDQILPASALGRPIEVDPGQVDIAIRRGDEVLATASVKVGEGEPLQAGVVLALPEALAAPAPPTPVPTPAETARSVPLPKPLPPRNDQRDEGGGLLHSPWFWAGVAFVVAGGVATGVALGLRSEPDSADPTRGNLDPPFIRGSVNAATD